MRGAKCDFCGAFFEKNISHKQTIEFRVLDCVTPRATTEPNVGSQIFCAEITISAAEPNDGRDACDGCVNSALREQLNNI